MSTKTNCNSLLEPLKERQSKLFHRKERQLSRAKHFPTRDCPRLGVIQGWKIPALRSGTVSNLSRRVAKVIMISRAKVPRSHQRLGGEHIFKCFLKPLVINVFYSHVIEVITWEKSMDKYVYFPLKLLCFRPCTLTLIHWVFDPTTLLSKRHISIQLDCVQPLFCMKPLGEKRKEEHMQWLVVSVRAWQARLRATG